MLYIILAVLMFGLLIAVHEFGHFASAKLFGIQVNEFSVGMGPTLLKKQKGETLYSLRALPIGGFCAMEGEDEKSSNPRAFGNAAAWKQLVVLAGGAAMNFLTGLLILLILYAPVGAGLRGGGLRASAGGPLSVGGWTQSPGVWKRTPLFKPCRGPCGPGGRAKWGETPVGWGVPALPDPGG